MIDSGTTPFSQYVNCFSRTEILHTQLLMVYRGIIRKLRAERVATSWVSDCVFGILCHTCM